ncbi:hypothetical protein DKG77_02125 [Flagellimonas aquimarina]|uniref:Uncharacterized protein n=1 Tax=Flagellimonas aquimarina TaxID=2201895 RepID=A0A316L1D9_9FLAO|nr:CehA/McbA family metallohydrolase [Allomuricauda koreensis]PWL39651.1 hypothetical protein DKG77_02125 [Allomuricauda koreensis]
MKNLTAITCFLLLSSYFADAQWKNRYPKVEGYRHHVYLEGYELPVLNSGPMDSAPAPTNDQVAFSAKGWLWIMDLQTLEATRITSSAGIDSSPNWSPDGKQLVFVRDNSMDTQIVLLNLDSKEETVLIDSKALDLDPIFSNDGDFVYYSSAKNGSFDLWRVNLNTNEHTAITADKSLERLPVPAKQNNQIVYLKKYGFSYDSIELWDMEKGTSIPLAEENFTSQTAFSLSPDNQTLAYTWPNGDNYELRVLNIAIPKSNMLITKSEGLPLAPKFSSDGLWIYFTEYNKNEVSELKRISINGGATEKLSVKKWNWGTSTGKMKITSKVDGKIDAVRMSITDQNGHPVIPDSGVVHSEGQHGMVFFYSPGEIEVEAPIGNLKITAVHGFSTVKHVQEEKMEEGVSTAEINLNKIWNANANGWYSADNHFHLNYGGTNQLDPEDILLDLRAEDLDIGFPLVANLGNRFLGQDLWGWKNEGTPIIRIGQEVRSHFLGHLGLIGTTKLYWPWVWGPFYDVYGKDDRLNAEPLRFAEKNKGLGGYVHPVAVKDPFKEGEARSIPITLISDAVLEEVDILELGCLWTDEIGTSALWHEFLNMGIPMGQSAGSDVMNDLYRTMAIGATRVYVKPNGKFTADSYLKALKDGRSFVSNGPQLVFKVNGKEVGDVINPEQKKVKWSLNIYSPVTYEKVEIFVNGKAVWTKESKGGNNETYRGSIKIPEGGWVTARVSGGKSEWPMMDSYPFAESAPIWFGEVGSTDTTSKTNAATKLLKALKVSEDRMKQGYGENPIPNLLGHFEKARQKLMRIIEAESK